MLAQRSDNHHTVYKVRRCFLWQQTYFQLDIYKVPCNSRCFGLILLETYSTLTAEELKSKLPTFLTIVKEVSNDSEFSMYNLSMKQSADGNGHAAPSNGIFAVNGRRKNSMPAKNKSGDPQATNGSTTPPPPAVNGTGKGAKNFSPFVKNGNGNFNGFVIEDPSDK